MIDFNPAENVVCEVNNEGNLAKYRFVPSVSQLLMAPRLRFWNVCSPGKLISYWSCPLYIKPIDRYTTEKNRYAIIILEIHEFFRLFIFCKCVEDINTIHEIATLHV